MKPVNIKHQYPADIANANYWLLPSSRYAVDILLVTKRCIT